jgi:hypothetical protein
VARISRKRFDEVELPPKLQRLFFLLLDGLSIADIQARLAITNRNLAVQLSRLSKELASALPESQTWYHLMAKDFMSRQEQVLRNQVLERMGGAGPEYFEDSLGMHRGQPKARAAAVSV